MESETAEGMFVIYVSYWIGSRRNSGGEEA